MNDFERGDSDAGEDIRPPMTITPARIQEIRELLAKATPGPWQANGVRGKYRLSYGKHVFEAHDIGPDGNAIAAVFFDPKTGLGFVDAKLIAAAVTLLPDLLDSYERMRTALQFYGVDAWSIGDGVVPPTQELLDDCGQRARAALHPNEGERGDA